MRKQAFEVEEKHEGSSGGEQPRTFSLRKELRAFPINTGVGPVNDARADGPPTPSPASLLDSGDQKRACRRKSWTLARRLFALG